MSIYYISGTVGLLVFLYCGSKRNQNIRKQIKKDEPKDIPENIEFININQIDVRDIEREWDWFTVKYERTINGQKYTQVRNRYHKNLILHIDGTWFNPRSEIGI